MPSKNKRQLNFFLLVKAYKENGDIGVFRQLKHLTGYKPRITPSYMEKLVKTAQSITDADLIDKTSGIEGENPLGDTREFKVGYWALFTGKYKPAVFKDEVPKENEFIAQIKKIDNAKKLVEFNQTGFRNKYGNTIFIPRRANISTNNPGDVYLDYSLFDNIIKTGKTPRELAKQKENMEESIRKIVRNIIAEDFDEDELLTPKERTARMIAPKIAFDDFIRDIYDVYREDDKSFKVVDKEEFYDVLYNDKLDRRVSSSLYTKKNGNFLSPRVRGIFSSPADTIESWLTKNGTVLGQIWKKGDVWQGDEMVAYFINNFVNLNEIKKLVKKVLKEEIQNEDFDTFNINVKYEVGYADIDIKGILFSALQKSYRYGGEGIIRLDKYSFDNNPKNEVTLRQIDKKYEDDTFEVKYNINKEELFEDLDSEETIFNYVTECLKNITYYSYRTMENMDTPQKAYIKILSITKL